MREYAKMHNSKRWQYYDEKDIIHETFWIENLLIDIYDVFVKSFFYIFYWIGKKLRIVKEE